MKVDSIQSGIVLDHITAGRSMEIYRFLHLDELDCAVAVIQNVKSRKTGKKDIIKIDSEIDLDLDVLGYLDPGITVDIIRDGKLFSKSHLDLPDRLTNVIRCKNPRCITSTEPEIDQIFRLTDREKGIYRCVYCDTAKK